jgi:hypothetical protein
MSDKTQDRIEKLRQEPAFREIIERLKGIPKDKQQEILEEINDQTITEGDDHDQ